MSISINKKIFYMAVSIIVLVAIITSTTYALKNYRDEILVSSYENFTTSVLQVNDASSNKTSISFEPIPLSDDRGMKEISQQSFTITNTGDLPYVFVVQFLPFNSEGIKSEYIKIQINDFMPVKLSVLNSDISSGDRAVYIKKMLQNNYLFPGESMDLNIRVWLDVDTPSTEMGKSINISLVTTGYADNILMDYTPSILDGDGTEESPYLIKSIEDLVYFKDSVNNGENYKDKFVKLSTSLDFTNSLSYSYCNLNINNDTVEESEVDEDISEEFVDESISDENISEEIIDGSEVIKDDLNDSTLNEVEVCELLESFNAIGNSNNYFEGTFDGDNHVIKNIPFDEEEENKGLFGYINGATLKNLGVTGEVIYKDELSTEDEFNDLSDVDINGTIDRELNIGGIVGYSESGIISNSYSKVNFRGDISDKVNVGGIVGYSKNTVISNSCNYGVIEVNTNDILYVGGIVGKDESDLVSSGNYNYGLIDVSSTYNVYVGGIVGKGYGYQDSINFGMVLGEGSNSYIGGIVGYLDNNIVNGYNYGYVSSNSSSDGYVGGIVGYSNGTIDMVRSYAKVSILGGNTNYIGGIVGNSTKDISNSINYGLLEVKGTNNYVGGIAGNSKNIINSVNISNIDVKDGNGYIGGIVGYLNSECKVLNSHNEGNVKANGSSELISYIGGIIGLGDMASSVSYNYNLGEVKVNTYKEAYVGGVVGMVKDNSLVSYSYNKGDVSTDLVTTGNVGGIVGNSVSSSVIYDYSVGQVTNINYGKILEGCGIGQFDIGKNSVYCLSTNSLTVGSSSGIDKDNSFVTTRSYMISSDFLGLLNKEEEVWLQDSAINEGLPYLKEIVTNN